MGFLFGSFQNAIYYKKLNFQQLSIHPARNFVSITLDLAMQPQISCMSDKNINFLLHNSKFFPVFFMKLQKIMNVDIPQALRSRQIRFCQNFGFDIVERSRLSTQCSFMYDNIQKAGDGIITFKSTLLINVGEKKQEQFSEGVSLFPFSLDQ